MTTPPVPRLLPLATGLAVALLGLLPAAAWADSSGYGSEYLASGEYAEPNILFVVDRSPDMANPCDSSTSTPCIDTVKDAIEKVVQHYDWARYGVVGTSMPGETTWNGVTMGGDDFYPIAPLGSSAVEISTSLDLVGTYSGNYRNPAEVLEDLGRRYFSLTSSSNGVDDDGDGNTLDWSEAPILYECQETFVIFIARDWPRGDSSVTGAFSAAISPDVTCDQFGITTDGNDTQCLYDNVVYKLHSTDFSSSLSGNQNVTVHTVGINWATDTIAENPYGAAADIISPDGIFTRADSADQVLGSILLVMQDLRSGLYSRSSPVLTAQGDYLLYSFFELTGDDPLAQGHVRAYEVEDDPGDPDYGEIVLDVLSPYEGALWDGGNLLVSRPVPGSEYNQGDHDGISYRDIYTFMEEASTLPGLDIDWSVNERRQPLDREFVTEVGSSATVLDEILDVGAYGSLSCVSGVGPYSQYDINEDCAVDSSDLQEMVDFLRGRPDSQFRYIDQERGYWKLGDSPYGIPAVVEPRLNDAYSLEPTYRTFLDQQQSANYPKMVYLAANDGMLHAFFLEDVPSLGSDQAGEEAWAWMPGYLLYREKEPDWATRALDLMVYGRTFLFDGSPVVADVWIDHDGDAAKSCNSIAAGGSTWADCEWHRVIVVQQGKGGPLTLALDITNPLDPQFLWEQFDDVDPSAPGYGIGKPVLAQIRDTQNVLDPRDRFVAMWGSGRAVPFNSDTGSYYQSAEANLYVWDVAEGLYSASPDGWPTAGYSVHGDNGHPEASLMVDGADADGHYEQAYIGAALAVVDVDSDGDADTVYFPVSTSYTSNVGEAGSGPDPSPGSSGGAYVSDPGSTWMYKACFDATNPDDLTWARFFDPVTDGGLAARPEVYYSATTSWFSDGSLGVYWGTGSPFTRSSADNGYFFAIKDDNPKSCTSFTPISVPGCGATGVYPLDAGEGLTGKPAVYAGVVYFTTWAPALDAYGDVDPCSEGEGRIYGLRYNDCSPGIDTNNSGTVDAADDDYKAVDGIPSEVTFSAQGKVFFGSSMEGNAGIESLDAAGDPFLGTATMAWMEVF